MAAESCSHDSKMIHIHNCLSSHQSKSKLQRKFKLPKGTWQQKMDRINTKIKSWWNIDHNNSQWIMSINGQSIQPNDVNALQQILSLVPPPATIKIIDV